MTLVLVSKLLRDARWALFAVCLLLALFSGLWVKIAQRITTEIAPLFNAISAAQGIPKEVLEEVVFKGPGKVTQAVLGGSDIQFEKPNDFLAVELLHPVVVILASLWAVGRSGAALAGEIDRGTMELLLSQPVPRTRLVLAHFLVDCVVIPAICLSIYAGTQAGLALVGPFTVDYSVLSKLPPEVAPFLKKGPAVLAVDADRQPLALVNLAALMFAQSGLTILVSAFGRSRWRAVGLAALAGIVMFTANVVGQLWDAAAFVRPLTVFFYYQPQQIWLRNDWAIDLATAWPGLNVRVPVLAVLGGVGAAGYLLAARVFARRDLPAPL